MSIALRPLLIALTLTLAWASSAAGDDAPAATPGQVPTLETVLVTGQLPGPGLWRVHGHDHELFLLGTLSPLPAAMEWDDSEVARVLARADVVLAPGGAEAKVGAGDMLKMATLARSANAAMKIPARRRLDALLPLPLYLEWQRLAGKYLDDADRVERFRPVFAAQDLYYGAIRKSGMTREDRVWRHVEAMAIAQAVPVVDTRHRFGLAIDRGRYKAGINALADSDAEEPCFQQTLETLEADMEALKKNANAWATGDVERLLANGALRAEPACKLAYDQRMGFQRDPANDLAARQAWLAAANAALRDHRTSLAVVPMRELVGSGGLLAYFRDAGFQVDEPE